MSSPIPESLSKWVDDTVLEESPLVDIDYITDHRTHHRICSDKVDEPKYELVAPGPEDREAYQDLEDSVAESSEEALRVFKEHVGVIAPELDLSPLDLDKIVVNGETDFELKTRGQRLTESPPREDQQEGSQPTSSDTPSEETAPSSPATAIDDGSEEEEKAIDNGFEEAEKEEEKEDEEEEEDVKEGVEAKLEACSYENWHIVNPSGMAGGLALAWKDNINVQIINRGKFFIAAEVKEFRNNGFEELTIMSQQLEEKVVIAGDFNAIISQAEKEGGGKKSATTIATFINFIDSNELVDIRMVGRPFTWTNRKQGEDLVKERLDRYLIGMGWKLKFLNAVVHRLTKSGSDHAPILMETEPQSWNSKRCFKYQEHWCGEDDVKRIISEITHKANSRKKIEDLQASLEELQMTGINGGEEITRLKEKLELAYMKEESYWREKSRVKWLRKGDQNTRFFHQKFQSRVQRNRIWRLVGKNNEIASKPKDIAKVAEDYFCDIFTFSCSVDPNPYLEDLEPKVTASMNCRLQRPVTMDEVKRATFTVHAQSAHGDDGFTDKFFTFFLEGSPNTSQSILELLEIYEGFSGQKVNLNKSAIFFSHNTPQNTRLAIAQTLNIEHIRAQDKYLRLPSIVQKSKKVTFGAIKDKVQKRIMGWKRSLLSSGGRHTLLRVVGEAIPIYTLSCFKLPDTLLTEIHSMLS
ncbi:uncharacterized protein [Arachis hypogaea]|uniref:uncharacterized protein n=1 Tax=Arachis hypogaea TaxID=3818 RepID=UPI003B210E8B